MGLREEGARRLRVLLLQVSGGWVWATAVRRRFGRCPTGGGSLVWAAPAEDAWPSPGQLREALASRGLLLQRAWLLVGRERAVLGTVELSGVAPRERAGFVVEAIESHVGSQNGAFIWGWWTPGHRRRRAVWAAVPAPFVKEWGERLSQAGVHLEGVLVSSLVIWAGGRAGGRVRRLRSPAPAGWWVDLALVGYPSGWVELVASPRGGSPSAAAVSLEGTVSGYGNALGDAAWSVVAETIRQAGGNQPSVIAVTADGFDERVLQAVGARLSELSAALPSAPSVRVASHRTGAGAGAAARWPALPVASVPAAWRAGIRLLPVNQLAARRSRLRPGWCRAGVAAALVGGAMLATGWLGWRAQSTSQELRALQERLELAQATAARLQQLARRADQVTKELELLKQHVEARRLPFRLLDMLAARLPSPVRLVAWSMADGRVRMTVEAPSAGAVLQVLHREPAVLGVALASAVEPLGQGDRERFTVELTLTAGAEARE